jgi:23S rRNA (guanosine2251-2'-O)-methyltransferase
MKNLYVIGIHAVEELLASRRPVEQVYIRTHVENNRALQRLLKEIKNRNIPVKYVPTEKLNRLQAGNHQGIIAVTSPLETVSLEKLVETAFKHTQHPVFLLADGITDARNFGSMLRSAAAFGVNGVVFPAHGSAPLNADVIKMSAGGVFKLNLCRVNHLADAVYFLKSYKVEIVSATEKAKEELQQTVFNTPVALVMGSEHKGISSQILKLSDRKIKIRIQTGTDSLNVSVATGIFLYEISKQLSYP